MSFKEKLFETFKSSPELTSVRYWVAKRMFMICSFIFFLNLFFAWTSFSTKIFSSKIFFETFSYSYTLFIASLFIYVYFFLLAKVFITENKWFKLLLVMFLIILFWASLVPFLIG